MSTRRALYVLCCLVLILLGLGINQRRISVLRPQQQQQRLEQNDNHQQARENGRRISNIPELYPFDVQDFQIVHFPNDEGGGVHIEPANNKSHRSWITLKDCVTVRRIQNHNNNATGIGWMFVENVWLFSSLFHLFHYLEFLVIANSLGELDAVQNKSTSWVYAPHTSLKELFGSNSESLHYLATQAVFGRGDLDCLSLSKKCVVDTTTADHSSTVSSPLGPVQIHGREVNNEVVRSIHPLYNDTHTWDSKVTPIIADTKNRAMLENVDTIVLINRFACPHGGINKMWFDYMEPFNAEKWYDGIHRAVEEYKQLEPSFLSEFGQRSDPNHIVVTYIQRQDSKRRFLSKVDHEWILQTFSEMPGVDFRPVRMQDYTGKQQMILAHDSHVLLGCHGNGMTHQFWMKPQSLVVEIFWHFPFQYDYYTAARTMRHDYLGFFQGVLLQDISETGEDMKRYQFQQRETFRRSSRHWKTKRQGHLTDQSRQLLVERIRQLVVAARVART